jgi:Ca2+/Na+ antiporter
MSGIAWIHNFMIFALGWVLLRATIRDRRAINADGSTYLADYGVPLGFIIGATVLLIVKLTPGRLHAWEVACIVSIAGFLVVNYLIYRKEAVWSGKSPRARQAKERGQDKRSHDSSGVIP